MQQLCHFFDRDIYYIEGGGTTPAVFYIADRDAGGILVNAPVFRTDLLASLQMDVPLNILFLPSRFGATDLDQWRNAGVRLVAQPVEGQHMGLSLDVPLDGRLRLTRTIDFLPMGGRTEGSCALRLRNLPGAVFFGPILESEEPDGWPTLVPHQDDSSWENRIFGSLGLQDIRYEYAFSDSFIFGRTPFGPSADIHIAGRLRNFLGPD